MIEEMSMMTVFEVQPIVDSDALLPGAQFSDAFSIASDVTGLTARDAARRMFERPPPWINALMRLRDAIVAPLGLKTSISARKDDVDKVGPFPVLSETPQCLVAGFDDLHLDFRVVVEVAAMDQRQCVTSTTIVRMHNRLGRVYLAIIKPFHRMVVRSALKQIRNSPGA